MAVATANPVDGPPPGADPAAAQQPVSVVDGRVAYARWHLQCSISATSVLRQYTKRFICGRMYRISILSRYTDVYVSYRVQTPAELMRQQETILKYEKAILEVRASFCPRSPIG